MDLEKYTTVNCTSLIAPNKCTKLMNVDIKGPSATYFGISVPFSGDRNQF